MTSNAPIDFEKEAKFLMACDREYMMENVLRSIAERVEAQTIERGTAAQNNGWKVSSLTRFYGPKSDKEEGK